MGISRNTIDERASVDDRNRRYIDAGQRPTGHFSNLCQKGVYVEAVN